jgi:hypothetical protein
LSVVNIWTIFLTLTGFFLSLKITDFYENLTKPEKHKIYLRFWLRYFFSMYFGISMGWSITRGFEESFLMTTVLIASGSAFAYTFLVPILEQYYQLAAQRRRERYLIEP